MAADSNLTAAVSMGVDSGDLTFKTAVSGGQHLPYKYVMS